MAGDWIKVRTDLHLHPKVVAITSAICPQNVRQESFRFAVVGRLLVTWSLADQYTVDGVLEGYTTSILDSIVDLEGWSQALASVGWLTIEPNRLMIPRFTEHNGESAKRRAMDRNRKLVRRNVSAKCPHSKRTNCGPEKRREEKSIKNIALARISDIWKEFFDADLPESHLAPLRKLVAMHGAQKTADHLRNYLDSSAVRNDPGFINIPKFVSTFGAYNGATRKHLTKRSDSDVIEFLRKEKQLPDGCFLGIELNDKFYNVGYDGLNPAEKQITVDKCRRALEHPR